MILVDTSIWIDFFCGKSAARELIGLLNNHQVVVHEMVYGELMVGQLGHQQKEILSYLATKGLLAPAALLDVESFVIKQNLCGLGLSYIDVQLLYTCLTSDNRLWTRDKALNRVAKRFDVVV